MRTTLCDRLGIDLPIIGAPMGPAITSPALAAAVSNAGGLGILSFGALPPAALRDLVRHMRTLTSRPFGVNFILHFPAEDQIALCVEERVPVLFVLLGEMPPLMWSRRIARASSWWIRSDRPPPPGAREPPASTS